MLGQFGDFSELNDANTTGNEVEHTSWGEINLNGGDDDFGKMLETLFDEDFPRDPTYLILDDKLDERESLLMHGRRIYLDRSTLPSDIVQCRTYRRRRMALASEATYPRASSIYYQTVSIFLEANSAAVQHSNLSTAFLSARKALSH